MDVEALTTLRERLDEEWLAKSRSSFECPECGLQANFIAEIRDAFTALSAGLSHWEARTKELERERDNLQARLTARAKSMMRLRNALTEVHDNIEDEGDRAYFGSTNDADTLKEVWQDLDAWNWDDIMADGKLPDVYESSREAHDRATALELERDELRQSNIVLGQSVKEEYDRAKAMFESRATALAEEVERLRKVAEPFGHIAAHLDPSGGWAGTDTIELSFDDGYRLGTMELSCFWAARAALEGKDK